MCHGVNETKRNRKYLDGAPLCSELDPPNPNLSSVTAHIQL